MAILTISLFFVLLTLGFIVGLPASMCGLGGGFIRGKRLWEPRVVPLPTITISKKQEVKRKTKISFQPFFPKH